MNPVLRATNIKKSFKNGESSLRILHGLDLNLNAGEMLAIVGGSGVGKSTFLHILGTLESPSGGELFFEDKNLLSLNESELAKFRGQELGFVFQFHHLISELDLVSNVMLPVQIAGNSKSEAKERAMDALRDFGIDHRAKHYPNQVSGGEQQRAALARAIVMSPKLILADEPTGNLDDANSYKVRDLLVYAAEKKKTAIVCVTHDHEWAKVFPRKQEMKDGAWL